MAVPVSEGEGLLIKVGNRSVSGSIVAAPLAHERVLGIDPAISGLSARGGHRENRKSKLFSALFWQTDLKPPVDDKGLYVALANPEVLHEAPEMRSPTTLARGRANSSQSFSTPEVTYSSPTAQHEAGP